MQISIPSSQEDWVPKIYFQYYEIWHSEQVKFVNLKDNIWKLRIFTRNLTDLVSKLQFSQTLLLILIMNMVLGTDDLDPKL